MTQGNDTKHGPTAQADNTGSEGEITGDAKHGKEVAEALLAKFNATPRLLKRNMGSVQMRAIDWLWTGWIPKGYLTMLFGEASAGKGTIVADIAARITTGRPFPGETKTRTPQRLLWLSSEDSTSQMIVPRLTACGADCNMIEELTGVMEQGKRAIFSMQNHVELVRRELASSQYSVLVIDPITSYLAGREIKRVNQNDSGEIRMILEPWLKVAEEFKISILAISHTNKDTSRTIFHRLKGASAFQEVCRSMIALMKNTLEDAGPWEKVMFQLKHNLPDAPQGGYFLETEKVVLGIDPWNGNEIKATRPIWKQHDEQFNSDALIGKSQFGPPPTYSEDTFTFFVKQQFIGQSEKLPLSEIRAKALDLQICSDKWWKENSAKFLDKENVSGIWYCCPKQPL